MNDIEKINVAPNSYFQRIVKPCLLDLRKRKDNAKTDMERGYYEDRYVAQAKDFAEALHISAEALDELIGGVLNEEDHRLKAAQFWNGVCEIKNHTLFFIL